MLLESADCVFLSGLWESHTEGEREKKKVQVSSNVANEPWKHINPPEEYVLRHACLQPTKFCECDWWFQKETWQHFNVHTSAFKSQGEGLGPFYISNRTT